MIRHGIAGILCCAQFALGSVVFEESFDGLADGTLAGKNGWTASPSGDVLVQGGVTHAGSAKAVSLANSGGEGSTSDMRKSVAPGTATNVVWSELYARPVLMTVVPPIPADATTAFYINTSSNIVVFDGESRMTLTNGPAIDPATWTQFRVKSDYAGQQWDLWIDGWLAAEGLGFYNTNAAEYATFGVREGASSGNSYVDSIRVWEPEVASGPWTLPFKEPFDGLEFGELDGQRGWNVSAATTAIVQGAVKQKGMSACRLMSGGSGIGELRHDFSVADPAPQMVHSSWYAKPRFNTTSGLGPAPEASVAFYVRADGKVVVFDGNDEVALTSMPSIQPNEWVHFETAANYRNKTWALWVDGRAVAGGLDFYNSGNSTFSTFGVWEGNATHPSYFDSVSIATAKGFIFVVR